ncbi:MAG TPA: hypothetical protein VFW21_06655, partial [Mycobacterium sp.]|nr:hypothetical protein [Mycobacterium sp.]
MRSTGPAGDADSIDATAGITVWGSDGTARSTAGGPGMMRRFVEVLNPGAIALSPDFGSIAATAATAVAWEPGAGSGTGEASAIARELRNLTASAIQEKGAAASPSTAPTT